MSQAPARADTRDVQNIGLPLVLPLTPAQLADDQRFRRTFGFRSDDTYIASLYDQVARGALPGASRNWAALLTADEATNMTSRQQLAEIVGPSPFGTDVARLTAFGRFLKSRIGEFGGEYFDQLADGAVVVLVTSNVGDYTAALAPILGSRADHLRVVAVSHAYQELTTLTQRLAGDSAWLKDHGVVLSSFGPDPVSNTVVARVPAVTDAVKAVLQGRYPGGPVRAVQGPLVRTTGAHDLQAPPMMGGLGMWRCDSSACLNAVGCTSGFIVDNGGSARTYAVMGAGHCGGGYDWFQGTPYSGGQYTVGDTATASFGAAGDAEVIPLFAQQDGTHASRVYLSTTSCGLGCTQHNVRAIYGSEASTTVGEVTCASRSQEADEICGSVTAVEQCVFYQAENTTVCHQVFSNFPDTFGDSGGPFYQPQVSTGASVAQGIASGSDLQTLTTYTQIAAAFAAVSSAGGGVWSNSPPATVGTGYCAHGGNATASSCINGRFGETYTGAYGSWNNNLMWLDSPGAQSGPHYDLGYHINWEMWLYTRSNESQFVEIGLRDGKGFGHPDIPCGCRAYIAFWSEFDSLGAEHAHWIANLGPDGSNHTYQIVADPDVANRWQVYFDANSVGPTSFQTSWVAYEHQTGLEVSRLRGEVVGTWAHADTFDSQPMKRRDENYQWFNWSYNTDWIDQPCGDHNGLPASPAGSCFNGVAPFTYDWQANKPN